jgi:hypothetical protein
LAAYLVYFVADAVDDAVASRVADRVRVLAARRSWRTDLPGFFDSEADEDGVRTTGGYVKVTEDVVPEDVIAVWEEIVGLSVELGAVIEVQYREEVLGRVCAGEPDEGLPAAVLAIG